MYHFNFKMSNEDAQSMIRAIHDKVLEDNARELLLKEVLARCTQTVEEKRRIESEISMYEKRAKYMEGLFDQMEYKRIKEGKGKVWLYRWGEESECFVKFPEPVLEKEARAKIREIHGLKRLPKDIKIWDMG